MNEMLGHVERQPRNKERRIAWLRFIEPLLKALGLFLLAHFRRIFPLFFQWMHSDDAETVFLVCSCRRNVGFSLLMKIFFKSTDDKVLVSLNDV